MGHEGYLPTQAAKGQVLYLHVIEQNLPMFLLVLIEARNQAGQGGFATAGTTDQRDHLSWLNNKTDVIKNFFLAVRIAEAEVAHFETTLETVALDRAPINFCWLVQLFKNTLRTCHTFLDCGADFRELTNRFWQQAGHGDVGHQITRRCITTKVQDQKHHHRHGAIRHQLQHRCIHRAGLGHGQLLVGVALTGVTEADLFIGFATKAAHHTVTMNRL